MKILLIHPEDELLGGLWASQRWDRVIDLGTTGAKSYAEAEATLGCRISRLTEFGDKFQGLLRLRELMALGMGRLTDSLGLDWWELTAILVHQQLELAFMLRKLLESISPGDEVHVTRPGFYADGLKLSLGSHLQTFSPPVKNRKGSVGHYVRLLRKFPVSQLVEIFWDKADPGYQLRGTLKKRKQQSSDPVVLLPSSYISMSRTALAYAQTLPETRFLLVATRRSGWIETSSPNVSVTRLSGYAALRAPSRKLEHQDLVRRWELLRAELGELPEIRMLDDLGWFNAFPKRFGEGLEIRDAWRNVLDREAVQSVMCADDSNPYTHIPLLLAAERGLPTIACHHGALDGRYFFKRNHADVVLAKGEMEKDYLVRLCGIPSERVEIGAPLAASNSEPLASSKEKSAIIFFSEPHEMVGARVKGFYLDILPSLADLAMSTGRELIIKLHPSESIAERRRFVQEVLSSEQQRVARVLDGPLRPELLEKAWFGVAIMSTAAVECALRQIPCFLCDWLDPWPYGYVDQFIRFDVGIRLKEPGDIRQIPTILKGYNVSAAIRENCWNPIQAQRLEALLGVGRRQQAVIAARN
jgi:hypothetical protein